MLEISNQYFDEYQFEAAIRSARNALNSWERSDSQRSEITREGTIFYELGENDLKMLQRLAKGGDDDAKSLRFLTFTLDINAPLYWWKQFMTYRIGVEVGSCSTMHTLHKRDLTLDDFSLENVSELDIELYYDFITAINQHRQEFIETKKKDDWYSMVQMLPDGFNQKRTVLMNYQSAHRMYVARKNHKLDEWHVLLNEFLTLPYFREIYGIEEQ